MSYSQYRNRHESGTAAPSSGMAFSRSRKESTLASEDEETVTQEGSFTGSSSNRLNPSTWQPYSSVKRTSKMGRLKTAPLPTRLKTINFDEEEEDEEITTETNNEKENLSQPAHSALSGAIPSGSGRSRPVNKSTALTVGASVQDRLNHPRHLGNTSPVKHQPRRDIGIASQKPNEPFCRSPDKKFPAPIRNSPSKHSSGLMRRHYNKQQPFGQDVQLKESQAFPTPSHNPCTSDTFNDRKSPPSCNSELPTKLFDDKDNSNRLNEQQVILPETKKSTDPKLYCSSFVEGKSSDVHPVDTSAIVVHPVNTSNIPIQNRSLPALYHKPSWAEKQPKLLINDNEYTIINQIGKGGSSVVYRVLDDNSQMRAVKKVDMSQIDRKQAEDFKNEISHLEKLKGNERIIEIYGWEQKEDDEGEALYVVMECGEKDLGTLLKELCSTTSGASKENGGRVVVKRLTDTKIKFYWEEMLEAVQVIHREGIVHRDLKPGNFVIVGGKIKLIDFGIASAVADDKTHVTMDNMMGTFNFMSPEAIQSVKSDSGEAVVKLSYKADVWSLGCILYNMVYNKMPFGHIRNPIQKLNAICDSNHKIPFNDNDLVDQDPLVNEVLKLCLIRDPSHRGSIEDLLKHKYLKSSSTAMSLHSESQISETPDKGQPKHKSMEQVLMAFSTFSPGTMEKTLKSLEALQNSGIKN